MTRDARQWASGEHGIATDGLVEVVARADHDATTRPSQAGHVVGRRAWVAPLLAGRTEADTFAALVEAALDPVDVGQVAVVCWSPLADEIEVAASRVVGSAVGLFLAGERAPRDIWPTVRRVMEERGGRDHR